MPIGTFGPLTGAPVAPSPFARVPPPLTGASWPAGATMLPTPAANINGAQPGSTVFGGGTGPGLKVDAQGNVTLPNGQTMTAAQYSAFGSNFNPGASDVAYSNVMGNGAAQGQSAVGQWANGQWQPETNPYALQGWAKNLGTTTSNLVNPSGPASNLSNGWGASTPALGGGTPATSGSAASSGMMGTGGMNPTAAISGLMQPSTAAGAAASGMMGTGGMNPGATATSGDGFGMGAGSYLSSPGGPAFGQGSPPTTPFGILPGYGPNASASGGYGQFQNFIPSPNYNPGGGVSPSPIGGYWNQMAQAMAGPMFGPTGSSVTLGAPNPQSPASPSQYTKPGAQGANSSLAPYYPQFAQNGGGIGPAKGSGGTPMAAPGGSGSQIPIPPWVQSLYGGSSPYASAFSGIPSSGSHSGLPIMYR